MKMIIIRVKMYPNLDPEPRRILNLTLEMNYLGLVYHLK